MFHIVIQNIIKKNSKIGIREIAEKAKVSIGTVDRVIHNRGEVSKATREKIIRIIKRYNYEPNFIARSLASQKRYTIATLIPFHTADNMYWLEPLQGIKKAEAEILDFGVHVNHFFFNQYDLESFKNRAQEAIKTGPDALLLAPVFYNESLMLLKECESRDIQYAFIDSNIKGQKNISYFGQDSYQSGYLAARLLSLGLTGSLRFLVVHVAMATENIRHLRQRENGFRAWFQRNNRLKETSIETVYLPGSDPDAADRCLPDLFDENVSGIFITSNAHKVARFIQQNNLSRTRLLGYDLTQDNLKFLKSGIIDFLICQKPRAQGYNGIISLFDHLVNKKPVKTLNHMPIDIITKENYKYYLEFE